MAPPPVDCCKGDDAGGAVAGRKLASADFDRLNVNGSGISLLYSASLTRHAPA